MDLDPLILSRIQFAFVVSFHALFPVFTIGLASYIAVLEGLLYRTKNPAYEQLARFWTKVFAVVFGMGVVSGIVMSFQFGTNWSVFSYSSANFLGPVLAYEVVTAFFLEAVFLGILLFGRDKVPRGTHLFAACMVALGTFISSFWILSANSWMQTPAGVEMRDGIVHLTSWSEAIFNPSFPPRFFHMALASFLTGGFVVAGVSAWFLLKGKAPEASKRALQMCMVMLVLAAPGQLLVGDVHGLNTFHHQPVKVSAMEGVWETTQGAPLLLFALPSQEAERNFLEIGIPNLASLILTHELDGEIRGLKEWAPEDRPYVPVVFWGFRIMVGIGVLMILMALWGALLTLTGRLERSRLFLRLTSFMIPLPFLAVLAGWFVTEVGRQPWIAYGLIRTEQGLTPSLTGGMALFSLIGFITVYAVVFISGITYLVRIIRKGPEAPVHEAPGAHAKRPFSAVDDPLHEANANPQGTR
ncbi:cytochrome ubiquinol oxidase subunit I [Ectothiorhodospira mobilis]|uniref:cytochrome ubiquinol oxidase subunit I n=1 Tax=Ectothiorhodospira mobilis TaxID=195064 RepID=UPI0019053EC8|nr:cytochrome ubiquinol oxidase subunit I [Ectothiorhodospira mobilis]MBK1690821.1 cytochrome ubiquinol oxidase subunit I [Ectothiorhodospira mobilis]